MAVETPPAAPDPEAAFFPPVEVEADVDDDEEEALLDFLFGRASPGAARTRSTTKVINLIQAP